MFAKTKLALGIKKTIIPDGACKGMTVLKLSDTIHYMVENGQLGRLYGGLLPADLKPVLRTFWQRYQRIHPELSVFTDFVSGKARPEFCIPCYVHGDEGRGAPSSYCCMASKGTMRPSWASE